MFKLLNIEWLKVRKYVTFWVLAGLFLLLLPVWNYFIASGIMKIGGDSKQGMNLIDTAYSFPGVWGNLGFWASIFVHFISVLVIILITNEYTFRTNRQNVIDGLSKTEFFNAKVMVVFLISLFATVYLFVLGAIFGRVNSGSFTNLFQGYEQIIYFFVLTLDYAGFGMLLAVLLRRSGIAIGLFFLYSFVVENMGKGIINHFTDKPWGNLLMLQSSDELLPFPLFMTARKMLMPHPTITNNTYLIVALGWCVVYYVIARVMLLKRDW